MNPSIINARAHALAHRFVGEHWGDLPTAPYDEGHQLLTFNIELWLVTSGATLLLHRGFRLTREVRRRCSVYYDNDFSSPAHDAGARLDLCQSLGYALLEYIGAQPGEVRLQENWYDVVACGHRYEAKNDRTL